MIVFDNIIFSLQKSGGVSVVWHEMLERIIGSTDVEKLYLEYDDASNNIFRKQLQIPQNDIVIRKRNKLFAWERYQNVRLSFLQNPFIFHSSYYRTTTNKNAINITTVHDFTYEYYSDGIKQKIHCRQKYAAIRKSDIIICVSENTKRDLLKFLPEIKENKVHVIHNGVSEDYFPITNDLIHDFQLPFPKQSYLLFVGSRTAYKRFDFAVDIARKFQFNLIIVGGEKLSDIENKLLESKLSKNSYTHIRGASNEQLNYLYNNAFCLIYPSEYEGFGIPVLEAQKAGCPVIAYNGSSIPEIAGETTLLFNNFDMEEISSKIDLLKENTQRKEIIDKGIENVQRFSWDKTYSTLLAIYHEALIKTHK